MGGAPAPLSSERLRAFVEARRLSCGGFTWSCVGMEGRQGGWAWVAEGPGCQTEVFLLYVPKVFTEWWP